MIKITGKTGNFFLGVFSSSGSGVLSCSLHPNIWLLSGVSLSTIGSSLGLGLEVGVFVGVGVGVLVGVGVGVGVGVAVEVGVGVGVGVGQGFKVLLLLEESLVGPENLSIVLFPSGYLPIDSPLPAGQT